MSEYTREEILKLIEENGGPQGLYLMGKDLSGIDLSWVKIQDELKKVQAKTPQKTPVWVSPKTKGFIQSPGTRGIDLRGAILWGADLREADLWGADLRGARLMDTDLRGGRLVDTDLREARLGGAELQGANLMRADLRGAKLEPGTKREAAELQGAHLEEAHLERVDFFCIRPRGLEGAYFHNAFLDDTRLKREQLGTEIGEERAQKYAQAKEAYLILKNNFSEIGRYDDAAWAYRKERRMEKLAALQEAKDAWQKHDWKEAIPSYAKVVVDQLVEWVCDYGESVPRILCSLLAVYVLFTLIYGLTWSVIRVHTTPTAITREPTRNLVDLARFGLGAMTTMDLAGLEPRNGLVELLAGLEALLGIALTGLLGFVLGNRIRRS